MSFLQERSLIEIAGPFDQIYNTTVIAKEEGEMEVKRKERYPDAR
jgi:hypothetical protein